MKHLLLALALAGAPLQVLAQEPAQVLQPAAPQENALKYLQQAFKEHQKPENEGKLSAQEERAYVAQNASVFPVVARALKLPLRLDGVDLVAEDGLSFLSSVRSLARLHVSRSRVLADDGDLDGALDAALQCIRLGLKLQEDGPTIVSLSGYAMEKLGLAPLEELTPRLDAAQLKRVTQRLHEAEQSRAPFSKALQSERATAEEMLAQMFRGEPHGFTPARQKELIDTWREVVAEEDGLLSGPFALTRGLDFRVPEGDDIEGGGPPPEPGPAFNRAWIEALQKLNRPIKHRTLLNRTLAQTHISMLKTLLAVRAYRLEKGTLPESLQVLVPGFLPALPLDPFELEAPLRLARLGKDGGGEKQLVIYSVGPDGLDDGGLPIAGNRIDFESAGDVTWPVEDAPVPPKP